MNNNNGISNARMSKYGGFSMGFSSTNTNNINNDISVPEYSLPLNT
jgi:hypothetical protein